MLKFLNKSSNNLGNRYHLLFISLLLVNYFFPLLIFGEITLFYHDKLDSELVYNQILGRIYRGDLSSINIFLAGEIKIEYLRRLFHPYSLLYGVFNHELAYWISDFLVKLTSYFSFYILAKKINKNIFICSLVACLFASSNFPSHEGFGLAFFPYLIYLLIFKKKTNIKHYLIIFFFGLNTGILFGGFALPSLVFLTFLISKKIDLKHSLKLLTIFLIPMLLVNFNLILLAFDDLEFHRNEFVRESNSVIQSFQLFFSTLLPIPNFNKIDGSFVKSLPYTLYILPTIIYAFFSKDKNVRKVLTVLIATILFTIILKINFLSSFINENIFFKRISWSYLGRSYYILYSLMIIYLLRNKLIYFSKIFIFFIISSLLLFQIDSSLVPFYKDKIKKIANYQNLYTFEGYYNFNDYKKIKEIVKNDRTLSVGLDPMVAAMHNIYVMDGYHSIYPLRYKKEFRKIIEPELNLNVKFRDYYDEWGSRVYTSLYRPKDPENFKLNYDSAKKLGAKYIISSIDLNSESLKLIFGDCKKKFCLYQIL